MRTVRLLSPLLIPLFFSGCGGGGDQQLEAVSKQAASQDCISCHISAVSPGTAQSITQEWEASVHNTANGAGCADCHDPAPGHPNVCDSCHAGGGQPTGDEVTRNPDAAGKCAKCHGLAHTTDVMIRVAPQHFGNMTASLGNNSYRASYVSSNYRGNCRKCHNPHDPTKAMGMHRDWAESAHGELRKARTNYDFKTRGTYEPAGTTFQYNCVRCHTSTGYINFVTSGFTQQRPFAGPGFPVVQNYPRQVAPGAAQPADTPSPDKSKEATACDVCHDNGNGTAYSFKVRAVPAFVAYYNFSSANSSPTVKLNNKPVRYPDLSYSNVCLPCHTGRGTGGMILDAQAAGLDFSNTNSPGAHDFAAGAVLFKEGGYEFPGRVYAPAYFLHDNIGRANEHGTGSKGPCVTCHMNSGTSHIFLPVIHDAAGKISGIVSKTCVQCHVGPYALSGAFLQSEKDGFSAALAMLNVLKTDPALPASAQNPSRSKVRPLPNRNSNYDAAFPGGGANTMGAFFNSSMLANDPGAFAHNRVYTKRLIYDSIDWLNNGILDDDAESAINGATLAVNSTTGKVSLSNPIMGGFYIPSQLPSSAYDADFAKVKADAIHYLLGAPGKPRP